ncbi:NfeD family protein [Inediibacterium massiliense]|uniref:NfeD family protein n=1 Tax=Inediibacterium massiliense TaxID=1658111 RepID=UPI000A3EB6F8|nr:NfeD family protein [Inediibacterium massiliense]
MKRLWIYMILCILLFSVCLGTVYGENKRNVYIIPINGEINPAVTQFVDQSIKEAEEDPSSVAIIFEIDTLGGMIQEATKIRDLIMKTPLHTIAFVNHKAESAGVLITISGKNIVMSEGSTIGSAETIPYTEKNISYWKGELRSTAEQRGRDAKLIESMADRRIEIKDPNDPEKYIVKKGELLNLTTKEAENLKFTDFVSGDYDEILHHFQIKNTQKIHVKTDLKVNIAQLVSSSVFLPVLLSIGFIGMIVEVFTPGFGIGGTISLIAFVTFFGGSMLAGNAGVMVILLFIVGIILLFVEMAIPGFGAPGIGGVLCMITSIVLASDSFVLGITSLVIALVLTVIVAGILIKYGPKNRYLDKIILSTKLEKEKGFVSIKEDLSLIGKEGVAITSLRPSGMVQIEEKRIDVVTEGEFVEKGTRVKIIKIEGRRIIVQKIV